MQQCLKVQSMMKGFKKDDCIELFCLKAFAKDTAFKCYRNTKQVGLSTNSVKSGLVDVNSVYLNTHSSQHKEDLTTSRTVFKNALIDGNVEKVKNMAP